MVQAERRRRNDPGGTRRKVIDTAAAAFQDKGYNATSVGDLVKAAGLTGGALHHHFPTKKAIGLAVISECVAAAVEETWIRPVLSAPSARAGIQAVFTAVADELEEQGRVRGCPLNNLAHELSLADPDFGVAIAGIFARWRKALADKVRADQETGLEKGTDPEGFAAKVVASYSGAMAMAKAEQDAGILRVVAQSSWD